VAITHHKRIAILKTKSKLLYPLEPEHLGTGGTREIMIVKKVAPC